MTSLASEHNEPCARRRAAEAVDRVLGVADDPKVAAVAAKSLPQQDALSGFSPAGNCAPTMLVVLEAAIE